MTRTQLPHQVFRFYQEEIVAFLLYKVFQLRMYNQVFTRHLSCPVVLSRCMQAATRGSECYQDVMPPFLFVRRQIHIFASRFDV